MLTWDELKAYARSRYTLADDEEDLFSIVWEYENGRKQEIKVSRFQLLDRDFIEFNSAVCSLESLDPVDALQRNVDFGLGMLALRGETYVVRHTALLATLDLEEFELPLRLIASSADILEAELTGEDDF